MKESKWIQQHVKQGFVLGLGGGVKTYSEDPETGAIECDTIHCRQMSQDPSVQTHALIVADGIDGAEALNSCQLPPLKDLHCWR